MSSGKIVAKIPHIQKTGDKMTLLSKVESHVAAVKPFLPEKCDNSPLDKETKQDGDKVDYKPGEQMLLKLGGNFKVFTQTDQLRELQTVIRNKNSVRGDFVFYADRLIRLVVEQGLNFLPYNTVDIVTPTGRTYHGLEFEKGNCGVSIIRSGEAMEKGLRDCCRSIRIGKILVESNYDTHEAKVVYAKFPHDIANRKVLLMYPILNTGNTVVKAVSVLREHNVKERDIILLTLFSSPQGALGITNAFPDLKVLTTELHPVTPNHFGQKYFGTDF